MELPGSAFVSMVLSLAYYRWGNWREEKMLPVEPEAIAIPSQVPSPDAGARCAVRGGRGCRGGVAAVMPSRVDSWRVSPRAGEWGHNGVVGA